MTKSCIYCFGDDGDLRQIEDVEGNMNYACPRCLNQELKKQMALLRESKEELRRVEKLHEDARVYWYQSEQKERERAEELEKRLNEELGRPTPKTLGEAIANGIQSEGSVNLNMEIEKCVRDYLAQHFNTAMLKARNPDEEDRLKKLFERAVLYKGLFD